MDITTLENWLWEAACSIHGPLDAPKYKDYILDPEEDGTIAFRHW